MRALGACVPIVVLSTNALAFQSVHVVNGGSGAALQSAIDAAASGDTILVHGGTFGACAIVGKALTIVSEPSLSTQVAGLRIASTNIGQRTTVAGLRVVTPAITLPSSSTDCIVLDQCAGSVRLEALQASLLAPNGGPALRSTNAADVALVGCSLTGSDGMITTINLLALNPGAGVQSANSRIAAYDCVVRGGNGSHGFTQSPCSNPFVFSNTHGAAGVALDASSSWYSSSGSCTGGNGGNGVNARCDCLFGGLVPGTVGANGGAGIANAVGSSTSILGTTLVGGAAGSGGLPADCGSGPGGAGAAGSAGPSSTQPVSTIAGSAMRLDAPTVVRAGQTLTLTIHGTPGDVALIGRSFEARWLPSLSMKGILLIGPSGRRVPVGLFPGSGALTIGVPADIPVAGAQSSIWHLQTFARDPSGALQVGALAVVTVLDPSF